MRPDDNDTERALAAEVTRRAAMLGIQTNSPRESTRAARLAARLYAGADALQRSRFVAGLLRPLGPLALVAVASGAFAGLLTQLGGAGIGVDDLARFSTEQIFELARFVEQVNPHALHQVARSIADEPLGVSAFGAAAAVLLTHTLRGHARAKAAARRFVGGAPRG